MKIFYTKVFVRKLKKIKKNNPKLAATIKESLNILLSKPTHPSLRLHKLNGKNLSQWSISLDKSQRLTFVYVKDGILLLNFGKHEDVY